MICVSRVHVVHIMCLLFVGYNSMSETSSPRSGTNVGSSVTDTGSEDGDSCPPVKLSVSSAYVHVYL